LGTEEGNALRTGAEEGTTGDNKEDIERERRGEKRIGEESWKERESGVEWSGIE
jgi:hypothetical protein